MLYEVDIVLGGKVKAIFVVAADSEENARFRINAQNNLNLDEGDAPIYSKGSLVLVSPLEPNDWGICQVY